MPDQKNLILAIAASVAILVGFQFFFEAPRREAEIAQQQVLEQQAQTQTPTPAVPGAAIPPAVETAPAAPVAGQAQPAPVVAVDRATVIAETPRVVIDTGRLLGSIALKGGRIDDLTLTDYRETIDPTSPQVVLLSPTGSANPYFAEFGWSTTRDAAIKVPDAATLWTASAGKLTPDRPVLLTWNNGEGLRFEREIAIDQDFMFTVTQRVSNNGPAAVTLFPFGLISRTGTPEVSRFFILHEGPLGVFNSTVDRFDYDDLQDDGRIVNASTGGWIGITDKYWLTALIPDQSVSVTAGFGHRLDNDIDKYQADFLQSGVNVAAGASSVVTSRLFAGAREVDVIQRYSETLGIDRFDLAVDWGWLPFLTKPAFIALKFFSDWTGNFGVAIILLTLLIKIAFFPLANRSYRAMSKMKLLQPEMKKIKERFGDDRQRQQQEMMALYKREKANPVSGCLPIFIQIPVFFALYNILFVTIEMRHAPFFGWIHDLSAPDPFNLFNLFGLIPWTPPSLIPAVGIWPILMGISMWAQMRLNPQPTDPMQARIFMFLPFLFTFILAPFPAGLVIYWTVNNVLSVGQQWFIMRRAGVKNPAAT
jgi:YidC/Oxa1 family membrane protein insertase